MNFLSFLVLAFRPAALLLLIIMLVLGLASTAQATEQLYTCGMHPQIVRKEAGDCPLCNMTLEPVRANGGESGMGKSADASIINPSTTKDTEDNSIAPVAGKGASKSLPVHVDARTIQKMNLKTARVKKGPVRREIRAVGTVTYDEEKLHDITTRYDGWIEKLHVNTSWAVVKAGDPLFEIYSPDLYKAQMSYLMATRSEGANAGSQTRSSLNRLQLYDLSAEAIADLAKAGEAHPSFTYRAPVGGTVIEKMATVGQMIKSGERIYRIADLSSVWVLAQVYESDLPLVQPGQPVDLKASYGSQRTIPAQIALVLPQIDERTRTATARIVVPNLEGALRPGMFVDVCLLSEVTPSAVLVPEEAVLRSGARNTVFVALDGGAFEPREIQLGARSEGNLYQVLSGLAAGERVVTSGQFMLDSESQLREAIEKMLTASRDPAGAPQSLGPTDRVAVKDSAPLSTPTVETCVATGLLPTQVLSANTHGRPKPETETP